MERFEIVKALENANARYNALTKVVNLSDLEYKISYTIKDIYAKDITCSTSDANIATCVVNDGYVTLKLRQKGKVNLQIQSEENNIIYYKDKVVSLLPKIVLMRANNIDVAKMFEKKHVKIINSSKLESHPIWMAFFLNNYSIFI